MRGRGKLGGGGGGIRELWNLGSYLLIDIHMRSLYCVLLSLSVTSLKLNLMSSRWNPQHTIWCDVRGVCDV